MNLEKKLFITLTALCGLLAVVIVVSQLALCAQIKNIHAPVTFCPDITVNFAEPTQDTDEDGELSEQDKADIEQEALDAQDAFEKIEKEKQKAKHAGK